MIKLFAIALLIFNLNAFASESSDQGQKSYCNTYEDDCDRDDGSDDGPWFNG